MTICAGSHFVDRDPAVLERQMDIDFPGIHFTEPKSHPLLFHR